MIRHERWKQACESQLGYPEGVPELVIEVRSASNTAPELEIAKRSIYCADPRCLAYWIVDPEARTITALTYRKTDVFQNVVDLPAELGFGSISIQNIFG